MGGSRGPMRRGINLTDVITVSKTRVVITVILLLFLSLFLLKLFLPLILKR